MADTLGEGDYVRATTGEGLGSGDYVRGPKAGATATPAASPEDSGMVNIRTPDGTATYGLPLANLQQALAQGYTLETPEQRAVREYGEQNKGVGGALKVGLHRFLETASNDASLGVTGIIKKHTGAGAGSFLESDDEYSKAKYKYLESQNELADDIGSSTGHLVGTAASLLLGGPLFKAAGKLSGTASVAEESILARSAAAEEGFRRAAVAKAGGASATEVSALEAAAKATQPTAAEMAIAKAPSLGRQIAGSAVEGGIIAAPAAVTEAGFGDKKAAAEATAWGIGIGAAMGVLGPMGHELFESNTLGSSKPAAEGLLESPAPTSLKSKADAFSNELAYHDLGGQAAKGATYQKTMRMGGPEVIGSRVHEEGLARSFGESAAERNLRVDTKLTQAGEEVAKYRSKPDEWLTQMGEESPLKGPEIADRLEKEVLAPMEKSPSQVSVAKAVRGQFDLDLLRDKPTLSFEELWNYTRDLDPKLKWDSANPGEVKEALRGYRKILKSIQDEKAAALAEKVGDTSFSQKLAEANKRYAEIKTISETVDRQMKTEAKNEWTSITDRFAGAAGAAGGLASGHPLGAVAGLATGAANRLMRTEATGVAARWLKKWSNGAVIAERASAKMGQELDQIVPAIRDLAKGVNTVGQSPTTAEIIASWLPKALQTGDKNKDYELLRQRLTDLTSNPIRLGSQMDTVTQPLRNGAPTVADMVNAHMMKVLNYVVAAMPRPPGPDMPFSKDKHKYTSQELADFAVVLNYAKHPERIIDDLKRGTVSKKGVDTIANLWEKFHKGLVDRTVLYSADPKAPVLPLSAKVQLGYITGTNLDRATDAKYVKQMQATFMKGGKGRPGPRPSPLKMPQMATAMGRLAAK